MVHVKQFDNLKDDYFSVDPISGVVEYLTHEFTSERWIKMIFFLIVFKFWKSFLQWVLIFLFLFNKFFVGYGSETQLPGVIFNVHISSSSFRYIGFNGR